MKSNEIADAMKNSTQQIVVLNEELKMHIGQNVKITQCVGTQKYKTYEGKFLSVNRNLFSIEVPLGKTGKLVKSFAIYDFMIKKVVLEII